MSVAEPLEAVDSAGLHARINAMRRTDNITNLGYVAWEYLWLGIVIGVAVALAEWRQAWGLPWWSNVPVFAIATVFIGGLQHRLAGLGHEASHYTLLRNKVANDLVGDVFCMFPIVTSVHLYRLFHLAHHQFTNDPERDPDLVNMGRSKRIDEFPMPRWRFVTVNFLRWLTDPLSVFRYQWDYLYVNTFGKGNNVYMRRVPDGDAGRAGLRLGTVLGMAFVGGYVALVGAIAWNGNVRLLPLAALGGTVCAAVGVASVPSAWLFRTPLRQPYGVRIASFARLAFYVAAISVLAFVSAWSGGRAAWYLFWLWLVPLGTSFTFFMLLRDVYQHANADSGRLTNSRVFFPDAFTRWAVFVYGQDIHVTHHLHPAVPHYRLPALHRMLQHDDADYGRTVVECHGTLHGDGVHPTILDVLAQHRSTPYTE